MNEDQVRAALVAAGLPNGHWCECQFARGGRMEHFLTKTAMILRVPLHEMVRRLNEHPTGYVGEKKFVIGEGRLKVVDGAIVSIDPLHRECNGDDAYVRVIMLSEPRY